MALTKLTKHIVHGATIVQVRFKDFGDFDGSNSGAEQEWGNMTITPQYADSTTDAMFSGVINTEFHQDSPEATIYLDVDGTNEYTVANVSGESNNSFSFEQYGNQGGESVSMIHRMRFGDTNQHTVTVQVSKNNNSGNLRLYDGFLMLKEIAGGVLGANATGTFIGT
jgi:hypothetical protein